MSQATAVDLSLSKARLCAVLATVFAATFVIGSWLVFEFDFALIAYGVASMFSAYGFTHRFSLWYQRPATRQYYRRACTHLKSVKTWTSFAPAIIKKASSYFGGNKFVAKRGLLRWFAHWPIMIGCVMAASIAFPLVFGWVWFQSVPDDLNNYMLMVFHIPVMEFAVDSFLAFMLFHGLVWASFPVIIGVSVALFRRMRNRGDIATQDVVEDILPLIALAAISITGLMLAISYTYFAGAAHHIIVAIHAITVIVTMLWLPYSKLMHVPQRTLKLAQMITATCDQERAHCVRCGEDFASRAQIEDLKLVEAQLGFAYAADDLHYQDVCPRCRRANLVLAQGKHWQSQKQEMPACPEQKEVLQHG